MIYAETYPGDVALKALRRISEFLSKCSRASIMAASIVMVAVIGVFDYYAGQEISSSLFFLIPIIIVTWYVSPRAGVLISLLSAAALLMTDIIWGTVKTHPAAAVWNTVAPLLFFILIVGLLNLLRSAFAREEALSRTDSLTGLYNRRCFAELASAELDRARRYKHPVSVAYMDLDNFKAVNDTFGHETGDEALILVAGLLKSGLRSTDTVARFGGDEFVVMLPEGGPEGSAMVLFKLRNMLLEAMKDNGWPITVSMGMVTYMKPPESVDDMLKEADNLMYEVKSEGKDNVKLKVLD